MKSGFKPCPFCGSEKVAGAHSFTGIYMIKCLNCGATTSFHSKEEMIKAIDAWNTRAKEAETE